MLVFSTSVPTGRDFSLGPEVVDEEYGVLRHALATYVRSDAQAVEFGVGSGTSTALIARYLSVTGFDSFTGLPEDWRDGYPKGSLAFRPPAIARTHLVVGLFADTLPSFDFATVCPLGLVHFDADLYSSTATALAYVGPYLRRGCVLVFDEWHGYEGAENHEQRAWREYVSRNPRLDWDVIGHGEQSWAIKLK